MSPDQPNAQPGCCEADSVTQAAQRLGVTERTVYRMLRSGKIRRVSVSDKSDNNVRGVLRWHVSTISKAVNAPLDSCDNTDSSLTHVIQALESQLTQKDDQIRRLMEVQQELVRNMERVQGQVFDVAQALIALQSVLRTVRADPVAPIQGAQPDPPRKGLARVLARVFGHRGL